MITALINLIDRIKTYGLEQVFQRYYSTYRAQVTEIKDEEMRGRIKVKIPMLFGDEALPNYVLPKGHRGAGKNKGEFYPPKVDDWIFVEFEMGDLKHPVWVAGGWHGEKELSPKFTHVENIPMVHGYIDPSGSRILYDETKDKTKLSIVGSDGSGADSAKEQSLVFSLEKDKEVLTLKSIGHTFTLDDTKDKEIVKLLSKIGTSFEITEKGTFKLLTKYGHSLTMDDEGKSVKLSTKEGANILIKENVVLSDSKSKTTITIAADGIKMETDKEVSVKSKSTTIKSDKISFDGGGGKMSLASNKVALGTGSAEVVDSMITILDKMMNDAAFAISPQGPCLGISPSLKIELTIIKQKLDMIKGSL
jgi:hypothetical protein